MYLSFQTLGQMEKDMVPYFIMKKGKKKLIFFRVIGVANVCVKDCC